jgi:hypothetical protein
VNEPKAPLRDRVRGLYGQARTEARESAARIRAARLDPPPESARLQRFGHGLALPAAFARAVLADPALRGRYLRVVSVQFAITVGVGLYLVLRWGPSGDLEDLTLASQAAFWSALYATLCVVEWVVIALSRDYHSALARDISLLTGVPPEDEAIRPSIGLDFKWMFRKLKGRMRGYLAIASAAPLFSIIALFGPVGSVVSAVLFAAWSVYWHGVFTTAKTARSWTNEDSAPEPFYLRTWNQAERNLPRVIRWIPATYGKIWHRLTRSLFAPASRFEASPYELTGLAAARVVQYLPGIYLLVRPIFGVAAAHLLLLEEQRRAAAPGEATGARIAELAVPVRIKGLPSEPPALSDELAEGSEAMPRKSAQKD